MYEQRLITTGDVILERCYRSNSGIKCTCWGEDHEIPSCLLWQLSVQFSGLCKDDAQPVCPNQSQPEILMLCLQTNRLKLQGTADISELFVKELSHLAGKLEKAKFHQACTEVTTKYIGLVLWDRLSVSQQVWWCPAAQSCLHFILKTQCSAGKSHRNQKNKAGMKTDLQLQGENLP